MIHLRNKVLIFYSILIVTLALGCQTSSKLRSNDIQGLKFGYLPKGMNTAHAISECDNILLYTEVLIDTVITDTKTISRFIKLVNELEESNDSINADYRIICLIFLKENKSPKRICFGEGWLIDYEGVIMKDDANLFNFLDELLYNELKILSD
jgi:hypothetical protein